MYGRVLMNLATDVSIAQNQALQKNPTQQLSDVTNQKPRPNATLDDLPDADYSVQSVQAAAQKLASSYGPLQLLDYARLALQEAQSLNPRNKDHPANLGRLHASWFRNIEKVDPVSAGEHLDLALESYSQAHAIAPQDVELTGQWSMLYLYKQDFDSAIQQLEQATTLDPTYAPNQARLGEARRRKGDLKGAAEAYAKALAINPNVIGGSLLDVAELGAERNQRIQAMLADMQSDPAVLDIYLSGYQQAIAKRPSDLGIRQTYTQVLSDTGRYDQGLEQAKEALALATGAEQAQSRQTFEQFITFFQSRISGASN
jgi:tetratricopeptide (TPR) repeat protein